MSRIYAGTLGTLAMAVVICRGVLNSDGAEGTLSFAAASLIIFAIIGAILGHVAQATVEESVQAKLEQQLAPQAANGSAPAA